LPALRASLSAPSALWDDFTLRKRGGIRLVPSDLAEVAKPISIDRVRQHLACVMVGLGAPPTGETPYHEPHIGCSALTETPPHGGGGPILARAYHSHL
jgi:hypothetical protein